VIRFNRDFPSRVAQHGDGLRSKREPNGRCPPSVSPSLRLDCRREGEEGAIIFPRPRGRAPGAGSRSRPRDEGWGEEGARSVRGRCNGWRGGEGGGNGEPRERRRIYGPSLRLFRGKVHRAKRIYGTPEIMLDGRGGRGKGTPVSSARELRKFFFFCPSSTPQRGAASRIADAPLDLFPFR